MGVAAQCFDCGRVVARGDQPFGQLCDRPQLIAGSLQVLVPGSGGQPEVVDLRGAHGLQDITSLSFDLMTDPAVGLCETCRWVRLVTKPPGGVFFRSLPSRTLPPLPLVSPSRALPVRWRSGSLPRRARPHLLGAVAGASV